MIGDRHSNKIPWTLNIACRTRNSNYEVLSLIFGRDAVTGVFNKEDFNDEQGIFRC